MKSHKGNNGGNLRSKRIQHSSGYTLLILLFAVFLIAIGLTVAVPVWETQIQRERETELIFRGNQYVEAVRLFQAKNPGRFPSSLEEMVEEKCLRRLYPDPMTPNGIWNVILIPPDQGRRQGSSRVIMVAPQSALPALNSPRIIGVVSASPKESFRIYKKAAAYNQWFFFYGMDPDNPPEVINLGEEPAE